MAAHVAPQSLTNHVSVPSRARLTSPHSQDRFYSQPSFFFNGYLGSCSWRKAGAAWMISDLHLILRLRMSGAILPRRYTPLGRGDGQHYVFLFTTHWQAYSFTLSSTFISFAVDMLWIWDEERGQDYVKVVKFLQKFTSLDRAEYLLMQGVIFILTNTNTAKICICPHYCKGLPLYCRLQSTIKSKIKYLYFYCNENYIQLAHGSMGEDETVCNINIQGVTGGTDQTSGECSLGQTIPI